jgi:5-hydroxyisourate hydrolase-like protein (transthyretin family)
MTGTLTPNARLVPGTVVCLALFSVLCVRAQAAPEQAAHTAAGVISGTVISAKTGQPLQDASLTLSNTQDRKRVAETKTDGDGRFSFDNLPDAKYALRASHRGYIAAAYQEHSGGISTAIVTGEGRVSTGLEFTLDPQATLYGVVSDDSGDPVPQARIALYRKDRSSDTGKMQHVNGANSDGMGNFEIAHLAPGNYYLSVNGTPWYATHRQPWTYPGGKAAGDVRRSPLDVAYPVTYYPDATDFNAAAAIVVTAGDRIPVNLVLHAVPAVHLSIQIPSPEPNQSFFSPQLHQDVFGSDDFVPVAMNYTHSDPRDPNSMLTLEFGGVAPGQYQLQVGNSNGQPGSYANIFASSDNSKIDLSSAVPLAEVSGKVTVAGVEGEAQGLNIALVPQQAGNRSGSQVEQDGSFHLQSVHPGVYRVTFTSPGHAMTVVQLSATGGTVDGHFLKIGSDAVSLTATIAETTTSLRGFAMLDGKPVSGVFVLLVPAGSSASRDPSRANQSDSDGSFEFPGLAPGAYTLVAIQEGWTLDWGRREVIAPYLLKGVKVTVPLHAKQIDLKDPVEVQAK